MNKIVLALSFLLLSCNEAQAEDIDPQGILSIAKIAGSCGILDEMIDFQKKTKLEGGNEFVTRFWETEAARRGVTIEVMSKQCDQSIIAYDKLWKASEE